jgi:hypothetical protein
VDAELREQELELQEHTNHPPIQQEETKEDSKV